MVCIGVCGEGAERVIRQLCKKYIDADIRAGRYTGADSYLEYMNFLKEAEKDNCGAVISEAPLKNELIKYDILIIVSSDFEGLNKIRNIRENGYLIINADDCGNFPYLLTDNINIITWSEKYIICNLFGNHRKQKRQRVHTVLYPKGNKNPVRQKN